MQVFLCIAGISQYGVNKLFDIRSLPVVQMIKTVVECQDIKIHGYFMTTACFLAVPAHALQFLEQRVYLLVAETGVEYGHHVEIVGPLHIDILCLHRRREHDITERIL